jgi:hypothetical protein
VASASVAASPYTITPSSATGGTFTPSNYTIAYVNGALTVTPAPLTVKANDASKTSGTTLTFAGTEFTNTATQNGETVGSVSLVSVGTPATAAVATYAITPSGATGGTFTPSNYTIAYVDGALTVTPVVVPPIILPPVVVLPPGETAPVEVASAPLIQNTAGSVSSLEVPGLNLTVTGTGVRMPPIVIAMAPPVEQVRVAVMPEAPPPVLRPAVIVSREAPPRALPPAVIIPRAAPPQIFVPPHRPRKPDRN